MNNRYTYRTEWSAEDEAYVSRCLEFPSLAAHGKSALHALEEIIKVVEDVVEDLRKSGEPIPEPLGERHFSGKILVRLSPDQHRQLVIESEEAHVSLNHLLVSRVATYHDARVMIPYKGERVVGRALDGRVVDKALVHSEKIVVRDRAGNKPLREKAEARHGLARGVPGKLLHSKRVLDVEIETPTKPRSHRKREG